MAKLTILIAFLAALVLVVHTSAYHSHQSCKIGNLRPCEKLVMQRIEQQQEEKSEEPEELEQCCEQLNNLNSKRCQCRALQHIFQKESEELEGKQEKQLKHELKKLPSICELGPLIGCDL